MTTYVVALSAPTYGPPDVRYYEVVAATEAEAIEEARGRAGAAKQYALAMGDATATVKEGEAE